MKCELHIRDYIFDIIPEVNYSDVMDGTPDSMSFSFQSSENLSEIFNLKEKCEIQIYDAPYPIVGTYSQNNITINNTTYTSDGYDLFLNNEDVGEIDTINKKIYIGEYVYFYDNNNIIYLDNRFHYYMCISQISSEKLSTDIDNGYMITVLLKEQTILLKDCIRTDIAITPSLYPQDLKDENGNNYQIFSTLYDAVLKIVDCHNMCIFNDTIKSIDGELMSALLDVACPNLTYRDLSTYSQLYDVFMRVGRIPYYSNGVLYGLSLQGKQKENVKSLNEYSNISYVKEEGTNDNIYSSKIYNTVYDKESAVVPQIFSDIVKEIDTERGTIDLINNRIQIGGDIFNISGVNITWTFGGETLTVGTIDKNNKKFSITYSTLANKGNYRYESGIVYYNDSENLGYDFSCTSYNTITGNDVEDVNNWVTNEFKKWTMLTSQNETDVSKTLLFVSGFNSNSAGIEDARSYGIELPYKIQDIESIYVCSPKLLVEPIGGDTRVTFTWKLERLDSDRIIENSSYEMLSSLQKRTMSYYVRGSKRIQNILASLVSSGLSSNDTDLWQELVVNVTEDDLYGSYAWSNSKLYELLRRKFFVVKYKPILDTIYTNYDYYSGDQNKPLSINNFNLPYSQTTDRQIYPVLEYNLEKGLDTSFDLKIVTRDISILDVNAGDIVNYNNSKYIVNKVIKYINNKSIECLFYLTDNVIQNSIISSYKDNVRISSVLSAESTVDRPVHIFGENVITLCDYNEDGATNRNSNYSFFVQEIGDVLSRHGIFSIGLGAIPIDNLNVYKYMSKYPFRFDNIVTKDIVDNISSDTFIIKMSTGSSLDTERYIRLTLADFPIKLYSKTYNRVFNNYSYSLAETVDNFNQLAYALPSYGYSAKVGNLTGRGQEYRYLVVETSSGVEYELRPDFPSFLEAVGSYWQYSKYGFNDETFSNFIKGNYRLYDSAKEYDTTLYGTEKLITTSGLITKIDYSFPNSSYCTSQYPSLSVKWLNSIPSASTSYNYNDLLITSNTPVYFNRTDTGCKLAGFGNKQSDFYSLYSLPHLSDKGYNVDLRENPRPYIQFKTISRDSEVIKIKSLSQSIEFMKANILYANSPSIYQTFYILKCPKFTNIDTFIIPDNTRQLIDNYLVANATLTQYMTNTSSAVLELDSTLEYSDNYDYILCGAVLGNYDSNINGYKILSSKNILKFNIKNNNSTNKLCFKSELYSSIN